MKYRPEHLVARSQPEMQAKVSPEDLRILYTLWGNLIIALEFAGAWISMVNQNPEAFQEIR